MPVYDAQCPKCGAVTEYSASIRSYKEDTPCCDCGEQMEYRFSGNAGGFILEGTGWPGQDLKRKALHRKYTQMSDADYVRGGYKK